MGEHRRERVERKKIKEGCCVVRGEGGGGSGVQGRRGGGVKTRRIQGRIVFIFFSSPLHCYSITYFYSLFACLSVLLLSSSPSFALACFRPAPRPGAGFWPLQRSAPEYIETAINPQHS